MKLKLLLTCLFLFGLLFTVVAQDFPEDLLEQGSLELLNPELVLEEEFEDEDAWEFYEDDRGIVAVDEDDEVYRVEVQSSDDPEFLWGQDTRIYGDVVIQVEAEQLSRDDLNGYGVMCRADPSNNGYGYRFYITGDGYFSVIAITGDGDFESLHDWEESDAINQGRDDNDIIVVCVEDYLAFYVNGELLAELEDDTFDEGVIALAGTIFEEDSDVEIAFDNLLVWEVEAGDRDSVPDRGNTSNNDNADIDVGDLEDDIADMLEDGDVQIELDDLLLVETWDDEGDWDIFEEDDYNVDLDDDALLIESESNSDLIRSFNRDEEYDDIVIHVEVEHLSDGYGNSFAVMCRVAPDDSGDSYSFSVGNDGYYSIGYWDDGSYVSLIGDDFERDSSLDESEDSYTMTVVCVDEYLALYVDGELIDEVEDDQYDEGYIGVGAIDFSDGVEASFDNLVVWEGKD